MASSIIQPAEIEPAVAPAGKDFHCVDTACLRIGTRLRIPIYDNNNVLMLARGQTITPIFLQKLSNRRIAEVKVHKDELARVYAGQPQGTAQSVPDDHLGPPLELSNAACDEIDAEIRHGGHLGLPPQGDALANDLTQHHAAAYDEVRMDEYVESREESISQMQAVYDSLSQGRGVDVDQLSSIADEALSELVGDSDLFTCLSVNPFAEQYPVRHSVHTSMLAMTIGTHLQLDRQTLKELAIGCLIHDAGMLKIKQDAFKTPDVLNQVQFLEITKHPILVFDMMKSMRQVPSRSAFVAYQIHERCNGTGYPRRREGQQIHFLSKVAAVADSFVGLVSPRPHRPGMLPYKAIEKILRGTKDGLYDPMATRALLRSVSLFPIGSYIELSDGRVGRVLRSNGEIYHRPVIEAWQPNQLHMAPELISLVDVPDLKVVRPLATLQQKVNASQFETDW